MENLTYNDLPEAIQKIQSELSELKRILTEQKQAPEPQLNDFLTREQTASRLKISLPTLNDYSKKGIIPAYRIGGRVLYKEQEVNEAAIQVKTSKLGRV